MSDHSMKKLRELPVPSSDAGIHGNNSLLEDRKANLTALSSCVGVCHCSAFRANQRHQRRCNMKTNMRACRFWNFVIPVTATPKWLSSRVLFPELSELLGVSLYFLGSIPKAYLYFISFKSPSLHMINLFQIKK